MFVHHSRRSFRIAMGPVLMVTAAGVCERHGTRRTGRLRTRALTFPTWRVLSGLLILPIAASACEETTGSDPRPLDITLAVSPESARVWVDDTLELFAVRGGREADSLSLGLLTWTVSDTTVLRMVSVRDSSLTVVATGSGTATVTARAGTFSDRADIVAYREGDLLASYAFYDRSFINGVAVGEDGAVYLLRTDGLQLVSLDSALLLRWSRDVGSSWMNPAIGPVGRIHVTPFRATMTFTAAGLQLWLDSIVGNGETAPAIDGAGNVYVGGFRFARDSTGSPVREWRFVRFAPSGQATVLGTWDCTLKTPPVIVSDSVVIWADLCSTVVGMSLDGSVIWVDSLASKLRYFAPSVAGDGRTVYLPARSHVYAIDGFTGTVLHEWDHANGLPLAPIVDSDGTIYI